VISEAGQALAVMTMPLSKDAASSLGPVFIAGGGRVGSSLAALLAAKDVPVCGVYSPFNRPRVDLGESFPSQAGQARESFPSQAGQARESFPSQAGQARESFPSQAGQSRARVPLYTGSLPQTLPKGALVIVAVRDDFTRDVAEKLDAAGLLSQARALVHCSGAKSAEDALGKRTLPIGTLHPLAAISSPEQGKRVIPRCFFALQGDAPCVSLCAEYLRVLGVNFITLEADQMARYHAAAVLASNHTVVLWSKARDLMASLGGITREEGFAMLLPLIESTVENTIAYGLPEALTGPARRGDIGTLKRHIAELARYSVELTESYMADAQLALSVALECSGADGDDLARVKQRLREIQPETQTAQAPDGGA
jgi:predicted short-subunit dehydrogenase-like oxidoreductase (DUF2520 family)